MPAGFSSMPALSGRANDTVVAPVYRFVPPKSLYAFHVLDASTTSGRDADGRAARTTNHALTGSGAPAPTSDASRVRTRYMPLGHDARTGIVSATGNVQPSATISVRAVPTGTPSTRPVYTTAASPLSRTTSTVRAPAGPSPTAAMCTATRPPGRTLNGAQ